MRAGDEHQSFARERGPVERRGGPERQPLLHLPAVPGIEALSVAGGDERVHATRRQLDDELTARREHGEDLATRLERRRTEPPPVLDDAGTTEEAFDEDGIALFDGHEPGSLSS